MNPWNRSRLTAKLGIEYPIIQDLNRKGTEILPYPLQRGLVRGLSVAAEAAGRPDLLPLWAGQSASLSTCTAVVAVLDSLVEDVATIAVPVMQWSAGRRQKDPSFPEMHAHLTQPRRQP
jgi:nitronate monooxygenase